MVRNDLKPGTIVWCLTTYTDIEKCKIVGYHKNEKTDYYEVESISNIGNFGCMLSNVFMTEEEAKKEYKNRNEAYKKDLADKIKTPEDLLKLMLQNMHGEEYTDYEAIEVVKTKAKELLNINL